MTTDEIADRVPLMSRDELWYLSVRSDLSLATCLAIIDVGDEEVLAGLAGRSDTPEAALAILAERHDHVGVVACGNPSAPADAKEKVPIGSHANSGINRFLEQRGATREQAQAVVDEYERSPHPGGRLLGDVWKDVINAHGGRASSV